MRWRTALGGVIMILGLLAYIAGTVTFANLLLPQHWLAEILFYPITGFIWIFPAIWLIGWTKKDKEPPAR
ncbi:DUF2842 domain-containing protein [Nisaea acidiphila]|uniref:DUF2842 domain-containing protein n=1 Tax=Nisaea acidiphila TaxID=1862145 RepID=A0A9J7AVG9_9PROT|nr:DUF2842 domain-containing protein [Nisaea acidiphila]UUX49405.1 DUF2842 domain-containing protein [Nisaea acidiphila]